MSDDVDTVGKGFMSSALLLAAVGAVLLAGWVLKSAPPDGIARPAAAVTAAAPALGSPIAPELAAAVPASAAEQAKAPLRPADTAHATEADPVVLRLATRVEADCSRLASARGRWTAQLLVACKPETVERLLAAGSGSTKIYVLPAQVYDDACFRVCFGSYRTAKDAAAASDLPKALRGTDRIGAVEIAKVIP